MAEARSKAVQEREKREQDSPIGSISPSSQGLQEHGKHGKSRSSWVDPEGQDSELDDDLFMSYRDLYYDEQVRRAEKLASAGERLKERMNNLAQMKSSRQTILDPRLSLNLRKRRRGQTLPTGRGHWSKETRPRTITEKARARASQLAFAYDPPRFTRSASMKVGFIPSKPTPLYMENPLEDATAQQMTRGIFGPRRGKPSLEACQAANGSFSATTNGNTSSRPTTFVERTVSRPAKSSIDRPYKVLQLPEKGVSGQMSKTSVTQPKSIVSRPTSSIPIPSSPSSPADKPVISLKNIPGITRRPISQKQFDERQMVQGIWRTNGASPPAMSPPTQPEVASSTPPAVSAIAIPDLPMLSQPRKKVSGPSLFIPRKKTKPS